MSFFDIPLWQELVTTGLGVFGGAWAAILTEGARSKRQRMLKARETLRLLRSAIQRDRLVIERMLELVDEGHSPSQRVFPSHYTQALHTGGLDVFRDPRLWGLITNVPPMLDHLNRRADDLSALALQGITAGTGKTAVRDLIKANEGFIRDELKRVLRMVLSTFGEIEAMLVKRRIPEPVRDDIGR